MICNNCEKVFSEDEVKIVREHEEAWGRPTLIAEYGVCHFCGCDEIEESAICESCGKEVAKSEIFNGICEVCEEKLCDLEENT
jgi:hypothetical protein